jgi:DNA-binding Lrp family transcriptional regulator
MLKKDARISFKEIARKINVSPDTISNRFERLKEQGIIVSSTVIINSKKIGYPFISLFFIRIERIYFRNALCRKSRNKYMDKYYGIILILIPNINNIKY